MADDAPWIDPVVVPDDIRSLQADIDAYHRERRLASRRRWVRRLTGTRVWRRWGFPLGVATGALGLAGVVLAVVSIGDLGRLHVLTPAPVAAAPAAPVGQLEGLLPDVDLRTQTGEPTAARDIRPALVALVPQPCGCTALLTHLAAQAADVGVPLVVVAAAGQDAEVAALPGQGERGRIVARFDPARALAEAYAASGVTVLVLARDATVTYIERDVTSGANLDGPLQSGLLAATRIPGRSLLTGPAGR